MPQMPLFITSEMVQEAKAKVRRDVSLAAKYDYIPGIKEFAEERIDKIKQHIVSSEYLWDMRHWVAYKDIKEVKAWVRRPVDKHWDIDDRVRTLKKAQVKDSVIVSLIMENPHVVLNGDISKIKSMLKLSEQSKCSVDDMSRYSSDGSIRRKIQFEKAR